MSVSPSNIEKLLEAGALLAAGSKIPQDVAAEPISARAYHHPALGDRAVVRLPDQLFAKAQDLEMEIMGFGPGEDRGSVAFRRRRGLGFPGWAIVNDPDHARYALEVVKEFKKEARRARSKPGHAKTGIDAIGKKLGRSVPNFLPSFYEEAGRAFIEVGTPSYGAQYFEKAREAERVHALEVDEIERRRSFVEFALSGAVSIKSLSNYAKELAKTYSPDEAYDHFRELCIQRTLGGMPPWSGMPKELSRLGKAAGKDMAAESEALMEILAESPSLSRAAYQFWNAYKKPLIALSKGSPRVRGALLNLFPSPSSFKEGFDGFWIDFLDECGALEAVIAQDESISEEARPTGGAAAWMSRLIAHSSGYQSIMPAQGFELLRQMAPRLIAEEKPISFNDTWYGFDIDLCDLALELGVPVKDPGSDTYIDFDNWVEHAELPERGRDPVSLGSDSRFDRHLEYALDNAAGNRDFERIARGKKGLEDLRRRWTMRLVQSLSKGGIPDLESGLERVESSTTLQTFQEFPEAYGIFKECNVNDVLVRTLQGGLIDELGWPALEDAVEELEDPKGKRELAFGGTWPHIMVTDERKVIVVSPTERVMEHDLQIPKKSDLRDLRFVDGELVVVFRDQNYDLKGYWSNKPKKRFPLEGYAWGSLSIGGGPAITLPDGGVSEGGRALKVGDTKLTEQHGFVFDGTTCWRRRYNKEGRQEFVEFDPESGAEGRVSTPAFFEDFAEAGKEVSVGSFFLFPLPEGVESSPLGSKDGLVGFRARTSKSDRDEDDWEEVETKDAEVERIDGKSFHGSFTGSVPQGLAEFPGLLQPAPIDCVSDWGNEFEFELWDATRTFKTSKVSTDDLSYSKGTACILPLHYWHCLRMRDEKGSLALRKISDKRVQQLIEGALEERSHVDDEGVLPQTTALVGKTLPKITDPRLIKGIVGVLDKTASLADRLTQALESRDPQGEMAAQDASGLDEESLSRALNNIIDCDWGEGSTVSQLKAFKTIAEGGTVAKLPKGNLHFWELLGKTGGLAFKSIAHGTDDETREIILSLLELWAESPFAKHPELCRELTLRISQRDLPFRIEKDEWLGIGTGMIDGNLYYARCDDIDDASNDWTVVELALSGEFKLLAKGKIKKERLFAESFGADKIVPFVAAAREKGCMDWDGTAVEILVERTGLTRGEASLLWAALPNINTWKRNFIPKELRETMGLKIAEAERAKDALRQLDSDKLWNALGSAIPDPVDALWLTGDAVEGDQHPASLLAAGFVKTFGRRLAVPEELLLALERDISSDHKPREALALFDDPASAHCLNKDHIWFVNKDGDVECKGKRAREAFNSEVLSTLSLYIPYLFSELPVGDPLRAGIPRVLELAKARLSSPDLLLGPINVGVYDEKKDKAFVEKLGDTPYMPPGRKKPYKQTSRDTGELVAIVNEYEGVSMAIRPTKVESWKRLRKLISEGWCDATVSPIDAIGALSSDGYKAIAERVSTTPVPGGGYESNPSFSVPKLVKEVGAAHDISEDGAMLYLQTLALAAPTSKRVQLWNGWKPARYKKAGAELVKRELLVEAKRSRAGRSFFLPGGWEALKSPHPPIEMWKLPLYGITRTKEGRLEFPLGRILINAPIHDLFTKAWKRIKKGDRPAYEEVS